jgi:hypothetical protein
MMQLIDRDAQQYQNGSYGNGGYKAALYRNMSRRDTNADWRLVNRLIEDTVAAGTPASH